MRRSDLTARTLLALASLAVARSALPAEAPVVRGVVVEGNRWTSTAHIERLLAVTPGEAFDPAALPALEQRLANSRLFSGVRIEPRPDASGGVVLHAFVEERRTLIPIPFIGASNGSLGGGLMILESNLFGEGKQLAAGGTISNRGTSATALYRDPAIAGSRWLMSADLARQDMTRERYEGSTSVYQYGEIRVDAGARFGLRLTPQLSLSAGVFQLWIDSRTTQGFASPPRASPVRGGSVELAIKAADYHLYFSSGFTGNVRYRQGVGWLGADRDLHQLSATGTYSRAMFGDQAISLSLDLESSRGDPVLDALRLGGRAGSRGFVVGGLWAEEAVLTTLEYQVPVWKPSWGVLTLSGFCDAGLTRWQSRSTNYLAPGAGLRVYLRKVALPGLGVDVAWASTMPTPAVSIAAGFRF